MPHVILIVIVAVLLTACTQIVTAPLAITGKVVTTTIDIAAAAGGAIVNPVRDRSTND